MVDDYLKRLNAVNGVKPEKALQVARPTKVPVATPARELVTPVKTVSRPRNTVSRRANGDAEYLKGQCTLRSFFGQAKKRCASDEGTNADVDDIKRRRTIAINALKEGLGVDFEVPAVASIDELENLAGQLRCGSGHVVQDPPALESTCMEASRLVCVD